MPSATSRRALAARIGLHPSIGELGQVEDGRELLDTRPKLGQAGAVKPTLEHEVLTTRCQLVCPSELADLPDVLAHPLRIACDVEAGDVGGPASIGKSVVSMRSVVVFPAPFGPSRPKSPPCRCRRSHPAQLRRGPSGRGTSRGDRRL
jgi:hypothetical protein